jgi:cytidyltransferase-like protein
MIITDKIKLKKIISKHQKVGQKVLVKSGIFDIIHPGHIEHIKSLKKYSDIKILVIRTDKYTKIRKGNKRPINTQVVRAKVIDGLKNVDYVFLDKCTNRDDTIKLLNYLKIDSFVLVQDYSKPIDKQRLKAYSNKKWKVLKLAEKNNTFSTTKIIKKILKLKNI